MIAEIPFEALTPSALSGVVEEFVSREGTDYGDREHSLEEKMGAVLHQLRSGEAFIVFDPASETCNIITSAQRDSFESQSSRSPSDCFSRPA